MKTLTETDFQRAASELGVPIAAVKAVTEVESNGSGFLPDGRPVILFERHVMRKQLRKNGMEPLPFETTHPDLVNSKPGGYKGGTKEHDRLEEAAKIHRESALESCSWGAFQIMGYHWKAIGYPSLQSFINAMYRNEGEQLDCFVRFVKTNPNIHRALKALDWAAFSRLYNGPNYKANNYDAKLASAFVRNGAA